MQIGYHVWWSPRLRRDMELKTYGAAGRPMLVFPSSKGRFFDWENFGMVDAVAPLIEERRLRVYAVDGIDSETWLSADAPPAQRGRRYMEYEGYVMREVLPLIERESDCAPGDIITHGCSFGAYHAMNFALKHPEVFGAVIALSGVYSLNFAVGDYCDDAVYFNDPLKYLPNLSDETILGRMRTNRIIFCSGQGAWEEWHVREGQALSHVLREKNVPHWFDLWGFDVCHDWPWWRRQIVYFLGHLLAPAPAPGETRPF